jgi:glycosyltransferase involved in cell wall biosynthesis
MPEVVDEGLTGFIVDSIEQAAAAVEKLDRLDRGQVRAMFERRFSEERMVHDYEVLYAQLAAGAASARQPLQGLLPA